MSTPSYAVDRNALSEMLRAAVAVAPTITDRGEADPALCQMLLQAAWQLLENLGDVPGKATALSWNTFAEPGEGRRPYELVVYISREPLPEGMTVADARALREKAPV